jgi:ATP-binding cassette subfamily F protein 3
VNLLILDEPTNHLAINAKQVLLEALRSYRGTVVFVSHDTHFIKHIANRILYLSEDEPEFFEGDYEYFSWKLEQKEAIEQESESRASREKPQRETQAASWKESNRMRNRLRSLQTEADRLIELSASLESQMARIDEQMSLEQNYSDSEAITRLLKRKRELQTEHEDTEERWFAVHEEMELVEAGLGVS